MKDIFEQKFGIYISLSIYLPRRELMDPGTNVVKVHSCNQAAKYKIYGNSIHVH